MVVAAVVVAVGLGVGAGAVIWAGQVERVYPPGVHALTPEEYDKCMRRMTVAFGSADPDSEMRAAAVDIRDLEWVESVREETQQQAYEHFKELFKEQPELVRLARPEAMPASVYLMVRKGDTAKARKRQMEASYPEADVTVMDWCPPPE
jgi:hypothetical protein